jgi:hypothetical protein
MTLAVVSLLVVACGSEAPGAPLDQTPGATETAQGRAAESPTPEPAAAPTQDALPTETPESSSEVTIDASLQEIEVVAWWKPGEKREFELLKGRTGLKGGRPYSSGMSRTPYSVEVLEESANGYVVRWTQGATERPPGSADGLSPSERALLELGNGATYDIEFDEIGSVTGLRNFGQVRQRLNLVMDSLAVALSLEPEVENAVRRVLDQLLESEATTLGVLLKDITQIYFAHGLALDVDADLEFDDELPSPFGGEPFPVNSRITVFHWDNEEQIVEIRYTSTLKREAGVAPFLDLIRVIGGELVSEEDLAEFGPAELAQIELEYDYKISIELSTGWPLSMTSSQKIRIPGEERVDTVIIRDTTLSQ